MTKFSQAVKKSQNGYKKRPIWPLSYPGVATVVSDSVYIILLDDSCLYLLLLVQEDLLELLEYLLHLRYRNKLICGQPPGTTLEFSVLADVLSFYRCILEVI